MSGTNPVTGTKVARPEAKLRAQMEEFDEKAHTLKSDFRQPDSDPMPPEDLDVNAEGAPRRLPPVKRSVPNEAFERIRRKAEAMELMEQDPAFRGKIRYTIDGTDIEAADHARKNVNKAKFDAWLRQVPKPRRWHPVDEAIDRHFGV